MKKGILVVILIAILAVIGLNFNESGGDLPIGENVTITLFESGGEVNPIALISIPFIKDIPLARVSVSLDTDGDGAYSAEEEVVSSVPLQTTANWNSGFYFALREGAEAITSGQVTVDEQVIPVKIATKTQVFEDLIDFSKATVPDATLGLGAKIAHAQDTTIVYEDVPDITQRRGECVPTAVANTLIHLINKNGTDEQKITDGQALITELKESMNWSLENGVPSSDIVAGKNAWVKSKGLPIVTTKVGDTDGLTTMEAIKTALENGDGVELRIKFAGGEGLDGIGGHLVTVTGINVDGDETHLAINDPFTEDVGSEIIRIRANEVMEYGPFNGTVGLSWGFVQRWDSDAVVETSSTVVEDVPSSTEVFRATVQNTQETTFAHVKPGEYSEIYTTVVTTPGSEVTFRASGGGLMEYKGPVVIVADQNGVANFKWKINLYGIYDVKAEFEDGTSMKDVVVVQ